RRRLDAAAADHDPADVAGAALQPGDHHDRDLPVLHAGVRDDERAWRPEQRHAVREPRAVPRRVRVQPHGLCRGDRVGAVRGRARADGRAVLGRASARVLRGRRAMTAVAQPRARSLADRGPVARSYRKFLARSTILMFALIIIGAYLLPLLYMVT